MASASSPSTFSAEDPSSAEQDVPYAMDDLLQNLAALHSGLKIAAADFKGKGASAAVLEVLHFLYCAHEGEEARRAMSPCSHTWPGQAGEDEKHFRDHMAAWVRELQDPNACAYVRDFTPALLLRPRTQQCVDFLLSLSLLVLQERLAGQCDLEFAWRGPGSEGPQSEFLECALDRMVGQNDFLEGSLDEGDAEEARAVSMLKAQNKELEAHCSQLQTELQAELGQGDEEQLKELFQKVQADFERLQQVGELVGKITARIEEEDHVVDCAAHVDQAALATTEAGEVDLVRFFSKCVEVKDELIARLDDREWDLLPQLCEQMEQKLSRARALLDRLQRCRTSADAFLEELEGQLAAAVASLEDYQPENSAED
ncbi:uncharacterized protein LOC144177566 isoform X2 [Haemaphysalis longicornis]